MRWLPASHSYLCVGRTKRKWSLQQSQDFLPWVSERGVLRVVFLIFLLVCSTQTFAQDARDLPSSPLQHRGQAGKAKPASHKSDEPDQTEQLAA